MMKTWKWAASLLMGMAAVAGSASAQENTVVLGDDDSLTAGIPGTGALTMDQVKAWLETAENHATLNVSLPLGMSLGQTQMKGLEKNPLTRAKIELGRQLYFDTRLSADNTVSCASCHHPQEGFSRHTATGVGIEGQKGGRNSPVSYNRILSDLQSNGRMTNVELAERAGISAPPCLRRVRALERAGIIKGYHAELSPETLGYSVSVFALVGLNSQAEVDLKAFEELIAGWDEVRECHMLAGEADFLLKIVAETWDEYQKFLTTRLTPAPNVSHVKTMMVFRTAKALPGVPITVE